MNILKYLKEKNNELVAELRDLSDLAETEGRDLTEDEITRVSDIENEIRGVSAEIDKMEQELRSEATKKEEEKVDNKNLEVRALDEFLRKREVKTEELRDQVSITTDGEATIPTHVENKIVEKLDEFSDAFAEARKINSMSGSIKIPRENEIAVAGFVGELEDVEGFKINLSEAELNQKRVGAYTGLTNQLVNDSAVDIVGYAQDTLSRSAARAIEHSIFQGKGDTNKQFKGILEDGDIATVEATEITMDTLLDAYNTLHPNFIGTAKFYMTRDMYNVVAKLKDGNGHYYVQNGVVNGQPTRTLFEVPIVVTDQLPEEKPIVLGSISQGYTIMVKEGMKLQHITGDTTQALRGSQLLLLDAYMDGVVHDPQAFVVVKGATSTEG